MPEGSLHISAQNKQLSKHGVQHHLVAGSETKILNNLQMQEKMKSLLSNKFCH